jgi:hypothetical protein
MIAYIIIASGSYCKLVKQLANI